LLLDAAALRGIARLRAKAAAMPIPAAALERQSVERQCGVVPPLPVAFTLPIAEGFRVTFTIDDWPGGAERHLVITAAAGLPEPCQIWRLLLEFGFGSPRASWVEYPDSTRRAVHIVEELEPRDPFFMLDAPVAPPDADEEE
jgi:hypothetical protein